MTGSGPLLELRNVRREFPAGDGAICALVRLDLSIEAGDMVAIVGASGSGKSTLLNILGCLDRPTAGAYRVAGVDTAGLTPDQLAALRCEHFGFVFQHYHLLGHLTALANVEMPAVYAGLGRPERDSRASTLLDRLGLANRVNHRPDQLSGGQQQRVGIARALMNGGHVILADEPTGALDRHSGQEMLRLLADLHAAGHTVVIVTHDAHVAEHAERVIELSDGEIVADQRRKNTRANRPVADRMDEDLFRRVALRVGWDRLREALRLALISMRAHRLRTFLTMLGIIIGTASVVSVVVLGQGSQRQILQQISSIGTNTIDVYPGKGFGDARAQNIHTLVPADADALAQQLYVDSVTPAVSSSTNLIFGNVVATAMLNGIGEDFFRVHGMQMAFGVAFDRRGVQESAQEIVIDDNTRQKLFLMQDPLGQVILIGNVPCRVIGVAAKGNSILTSPDALNVFVPYTTAMARILGTHYLRSITVRVSDTAPIDAAQQAIVSLLSTRHGAKDIFVNNNDTIRKTMQSSTRSLTLLISSIAFISLIVGGIGVMNIMLVSVTERTREIGLRMAVGARQSDILQQFLTEAVLVCVIGGALGIGIAFGFGAAFSYFAGNFPMVFSPLSMIVAFACSTLIGIVFGFWPARSAAKLDPVVALSRS
jgi:macrolide transport system ATP-binding/permease protein